MPSLRINYTLLSGKRLPLPTNVCVNYDFQGVVFQLNGDSTPPKQSIPHLSANAHCIVDRELMFCNEGLVVFFFSEKFMGHKRAQIVSKSEGHMVGARLAASIWHPLPIISKKLIRAGIRVFGRGMMQSWKSANAGICCHPIHHYSVLWRKNIDS